MQKLGERWIRGQERRVRWGHRPAKAERNQCKYSGMEGEAPVGEGRQDRVGNYRGPERRPVISLPSGRNAAHLLM